MAVGLGRAGGPQHGHCTPRRRTGHGVTLGRSGKGWVLEDSGAWQAFCLGQVDQGGRLWEERSGLEVQGCREVHRGDGVRVRLQRGSGVRR